MGNAMNIYITLCFCQWNRQWIFKCESTCGSALGVKTPPAGHTMRQCEMSTGDMVFHLVVRYPFSLKINHRKNNLEQSRYLKTRNQEFKFCSFYNLNLLIQQSNHKIKSVHIFLLHMAPPQGWITRKASWIQDLPIYLALTCVDLGQGVFLTWQTSTNSMRTKGPAENMGGKTNAETTHCVSE